MNERNTKNRKKENQERMTDSKNGKKTRLNVNEQ